MADGHVANRHSAIGTRQLGADAAFRLPAILFEVGRQRPAAADPAAQLIAEFLAPALWLMGILVEQRTVALEVMRSDRWPAFAEGHGPDIGGPPLRPMPAKDLARIAFEEHF